MKRSALGIAVGALLAFVPAAHASPVAPFVAADANGDPVLYSWINAASQPVTWRQCTVGGACVVRVETGHALSPGPTSPDTYFESTIEWTHGSSDTWTSPVWDGRYVDISPPTLSGSFVVGTTVAVEPGASAGGWAGLTSTRLLSCKAADGLECDLLRTGEPLSAEHLGRHLFVTRSHAGHHYFPYYSAGVGAERTSGPYGPVTGPPTPAARIAPALQTGPPASAKPVSVSLRTRALRRNGRLELGRVTCVESCSVRLTVNGRSRTFRMTGTRTLTTPVRKGRLKVRVAVDGKRLASATLKR